MQTDKIEASVKKQLANKNVFKPSPFKRKSKFSSPDQKRMTTQRTIGRENMTLEEI